MSVEDPSDGGYEPPTALRVGLGVVAVLVLAYSFLVATRPLLGVLAVGLPFVAYLCWRSFRLAVRFVRAVERIADATEVLAREEQSRQ